MPKKYDWLIVGAGFTGAVIAERIATQLDQRVLIVDRRDHIAGNAFDTRNEAGNLIHLYGPHIFHTNSPKVFHHLSRFTRWRPYFHHVLGHVDGRFVPVPFNLETLDQLFPQAMAQRMADALVAHFGFGTKVPITKLRQAEGDEMSFLADYIYDKLFLNYTMKQWGCTPEQLDASVTARVPIVISRDSRYFGDIYQAMPVDGYTAMFERMLDHPNIDIELGVDFAHLKDAPPADRIVYTGPIDEFFGHCEGALPYRSLRFEFETHAGGRVQPVGTVNYPNEFDFTRITDFSHLTGETHSHTTTVCEFPQAYVAGENDPYYPVPSPETKSRVQPYRQMAQELKGKVWFAGRLADYVYYNMDQACARGLSLFEKELAPAALGMEVG
ncbi:UDP-galactopyranose mutase [Aureimonas populi]|uniref:UDP-galactopyranose mutase n=1 Tax=Aureimonas populi TaxID=1701758 RepID=A0ABW5CKS6_9HYPH|nr:UDP-galactopyranose mutase [Aureimonas populi]